MYMPFVDHDRQEILYNKAIHMRFQGKSCIEIGESVGIKAKSVSVWFSKGGAIYKQYREFCEQKMGILAHQSDSVAGILKNEAVPSLNTIKKIRDTKRYNPSVRYQCAADLLDRAGYSPVQKTANIHMIDSMSSNELDDAFSSVVTDAEKRLKDVPERKPRVSKKRK